MAAADERGLLHGARCVVMWVWFCGRRVVAVGRGTGVVSGGVVPAAVVNGVVDTAFVVRMRDGGL